MKKVIIAILSILCLATFFGCGESGKDTRTYVIIFEQSGEKNIKQTTTTNELDASKIPVPKQKEGYDVVWDRQDFTNIRTNITVRAVETPKKYRVTFDANGGLFESGSSSVTRSIEYGAYWDNENKPQKDGERFFGWTYNGVVYDSSTWDINVDGEIVLKALWGKGKPNVEFRFRTDVWQVISNDVEVEIDLNGNGYIRQEYRNGIKIKLPEMKCVTQFEDMEFLGWQCNGEKIEDGIWERESQNDQLIIIEPIQKKTEVTFEFNHSLKYGEKSLNEWILSYGSTTENVKTVTVGDDVVSTLTLEFLYGQEIALLPVVSREEFIKTNVGFYFNVWESADGLRLIVDDFIGVGGSSEIRQNVLKNGRWAITQERVILRINIDEISANSPPV